MKQFLIKIQKTFKINTRYKTIELNKPKDIYTNLSINFLLKKVLKKDSQTKIMMI